MRLDLGATQRRSSMRGDPYERPRVDDRTSVSEPLNVINTSSGGLRTPVWRPRENGQEAAAAGYQSPGVVERTSVSEPLNAASSSQLFTPAWRATRRGSSGPVRAWPEDARRDGGSAMPDEGYQRPAVVGRTSVTEPLNTINHSVVVPPLTLAWRRLTASDARQSTTRERGNDAR
jgi:hypothetical protein